MRNVASRLCEVGRPRLAARALLSVLLLAFPVGPAFALTVTAQVDRVTYEDFVATGIDVVAELGEAGGPVAPGVVVRAGQVSLASDWRLQQVEIHCNQPAGDDPGATARPSGNPVNERGGGVQPQAQASLPELCRGASWRLALERADMQPALEVRGAIDEIRFDDDWALRSEFSSGDFAGRFEARRDGGSVSTQVDWDGQPIQAMQAWPLPLAALEWVMAGRTSGRLSLRLPADGPGTAEFRTAVDGLDFDSPDGLYAGAALAFGVEGSAEWSGSPRLVADVSIGAGELLLDRFYTAFEEVPLSLHADIEVGDDRIHLREGRVDDGRALKVEARAQFDPAEPLDSLEYRVDRLELNFPGAYERYLEPLLGPLSLDGLTLTGAVRWQGEGPAITAAGAAGSGFPEGRLEISDLSIVDRERERFAVTGLEAELHAGSSPIDSRVSWRGLLLQRINLGSGAAVIATAPGRFALAEPLRLDVLGGRLSLDRIDVRLPSDTAAAGSEPEVTVQASLDDMEMGALTEALDWPRFEGRISGDIPGVSLEGGVLSVDGRIDVEVFDGSLHLSGLRVERPFGVLPSLAADLEVDNLDLERLTHTFSFGRISGRLDGYMRDLRMLDWKPVAFDAWFGTPVDQQESRAISRQAVNRLTTIGGGGPTAALTGPLMRLFSNFSYRRLGMGCVLSNNVCVLRGLDDDPNSVLIMEGSGVPKIMIRAYNRRMDFPQLVANLAAASEGEGIRVGDGE
ncbi:hypothetical protein [Elongatibacter sediminis]|uniref:Dicarboxylate transport domain-containing protein n=1 Tax=Elongatibacter sediminis TaxID=3119006 RepID=A0AAW9RCW8_9GAMM